MSRLPVLLIVTVLCLPALALSACGGGGEESPRQVLEGVNFEGVESADFDASLKIASADAKKGAVDIDVSGRAAAEGLEATATIKGTAKGKKVDFEGGVTLLDDHGFVNYQGTEYEIEQSYYEFAESLFLPGLTQKGREAGIDVDSCARVAARIQPARLVDHLRDEGSVEVDGTETTKLSGELDAAAAADALVGLVEDPSCRSQYGALSPMPVGEFRRSAGQLAESVEVVKVDLYVDGDGVVRKLEAELTADPKGAEAPIAVDFELNLSEVNANQRIEAPLVAQPLAVLFGKLGVNALEFLGFRSGGEAVRSLSEKVAADAFP